MGLAVEATLVRRSVCRCPTPVGRRGVVSPAGPGGGGARVDGVVESISSATGARFALLPPDNATGNFTKVVQRVPVRILLTSTLGAARPLRPGMSVAAHVATR